MISTVLKKMTYGNKNLDNPKHCRANSIIQLTAWIYGIANANYCILSDINECGCSILLPKDKSTPTNPFKLLILSPNNNTKIHSVLNSKTLWQDNNFTQSYKKIGIKFQKITDEQHCEVSMLENLFYNAAPPLIKCRLLNH